MMEQNAVRCSKPFRCLIADDSVFARKNMAKVVETSGGEVASEAENGIEAIDLYFRMKPDIVLLDITMPDLDGVETLNRIMERDSEAKVIMVSSVGHTEMVRKAVRIGAKHFISKPYNQGYACMIIKSVIEDEEGGLKCDTNT